MSTPSMAAQVTEGELKLLQALVYQECGMHFDERRAHYFFRIACCAGLK